MSKIDKNLPIGGTFELYGKTYMVVRNENALGCSSCAFHDTLMCGRFVDRPYCAKPRREDGANVIFKEVKTTTGPTVQTQIFEEPATSAFLPVGSIFTRNNNKYIVVTGGTCHECVFTDDSKGCAGAPRCLSSDRKDGTGVIFKLLHEVTSVSAETTDKSDTKKDCALNENELIYDGNKYIAKSVDYTVPACEGCGGSKVNANGNIECTFARNGIRPHCTPVSRKDGQRVIFVEQDKTPIIKEDKIIDENNFIINGVEYVAKIVNYSTCTGCAFEGHYDKSGKPVCTAVRANNKRPGCSKSNRSDLNNVIFVPKEDYVLDENEFTYNNKKYIAIGSTRSSARCKLCAFNTIINGKNICCTSLDQGKRPSCYERERRDARYVYFIEKETIANNINQKTNNMKNYIEKIKSLILPSTNNDFVFTMDGKLGLRKDDKIISYDKTTNEFTEYPSDFGIEIPVFEISTPSNQIKEGDVIKHNNSWCIVKSVKDNNISVLSYTGTSKKVQVVNNFLLGQKVVRKIMSFDIQGNNNNNMNPMMMLALMDGKDSNDTVKTMLMMQMMQSNNKGFNPMMMLMLDKSIDMKDLLMMNMMGGMQMPFFGNSSDSPASK